MFNTRGFIVVASAVAVAAAAVALAPQHQNDEPAKVRLGVYDSRGVAIAWARSDYNTIRESMKAYQKAKAEGDEAEQKRLEDWGQMQQRLLHFQGFGHYPVDDYLAAVQDQLPKLLEDRDLVAIVWTPAAKADNVEPVDVTVDLMKMFGMDEAEAAKMAGELAKHEPLDFTTLFNMSPMD